jgi:hypothetical protein
LYKTNFIFFAALMIGLIVFLPCAVLADTAIIKGMVGLKMGSGKYVPGRIITIFLVTEAIGISESIDTEGLDRFERIEKLNRYHMAFYKTFWKKSLDPRYFVTQTVSDDHGFFEFKNIKPGKYYVLVTFPTIIGGNKVVWQVPVMMEPPSHTKVTLNNENLVLPAYSRYSTLKNNAFMFSKE